VTGRRALAPLALALLFARCSGSGGGGGTPTEPGGPTLSLTAQSTVLFLGATTTLDALARQGDGRPLAGATVTFSSTLGLLSAASAQTDAQGRASVQMRGTEPGVAVVTARLGDALPAQVSVQVGQGSAILVLPESSTIAADGETSISIRVARRDGAPTPAGTVVEVTTSLGAIADPRPRTDSNGVARTALRGNGASGTATVRAVLAGQADAGQAEVRIGGGDRIRLGATPPVIAPQGTSRITALVTDAAGAPAGAGTVVHLTTDLGRLDATDLATDASGAAATTFRASGATGVAAISAEARGVSAVLAVTIDGSARLRLRANPPSLAPTGSTTISVVASFVDGAPLPAGSRIRLSASLGRLDASDLATDSSGAAATVLRGDGARGTARVIATAEEFGGSGTVDVPIR
jgi:adhesin/invasin